MAVEFGATHTLLADRADTGLLKAALQIKQMTDGRGADYAFECTAIPELGAAVPFYGRNPEPIDSVANVKATVLAFYGGEDARINAGIPAMEEAMKKNGKKFDYKIFPGAPHAFFNERKTNFHESSASEAWEKMLAFFNENLRK